MFGLIRGETLVWIARPYPPWGVLFLTRSNAQQIETEKMQLQMGN